MFSVILSFICGILVLVIDQITKYFITLNFELGQSADFLKGFIDITYIHNQGGAWGMLSGKTSLLVVVTAVVMVGCVVIIIKNANKSKLLVWSLNFVLFGGIGNMIDRIFKNGNVVDFLHFEFWPQFPVFNVADCAIVVGACLLFLYYLLDIIKDFKAKKCGEQGENADN